MESLKTPSIKIGVKKRNSQESEDLPEDEAPSSDHVKEERADPAAPVNQEELDRFWKKFAEGKKASGKDSEHQVMCQPHKLLSDFTIQITLASSIQEDILNMFKTDLLTFLRAELNNQKLTIITEVDREISTRKPYTDKEKLAFLIEKKPELKDLVDRLGLDTG